MPQKTPQALEYIRALRDDRTLTASEKLAAAIMASHAGHDGMNAHPGHKLLGEETATSERSSKRSVAALVEKGWLTQTSSGRGNSRYASVYALSLPQSATGGTLAPESTGQAEQAKVPNETGRDAISDSQSATGGPTNQPLEITQEIPVSQISDLSDGVASLSTQELTGQGGDLQADGAAVDEDEDEDGWEDCPSSEALVEDINEVLAGIWPRENYPDAEAFDPRFLKGGTKRLAFIVRLVNTHRFDTDDLVTGMFDASPLRPDLGEAEHSADLVTRPARIVGRVLSGSDDQILAYAQRGKQIIAARAEEATAEVAARAEAEQFAAEDEAA